ncbi:TonB-dependent siderophore receptor [Pseudothauera rhizosphaerae]|uniref:TonB-dependent siderophore receptor n=1 Tax=Pseudothauera rhizosphaerae TaxID=2565932 RepID=A0A4S4AL01_9RHOO|nr:TonB-dependent siderophore receptor [Pseudothauera rhizosphaerae]THF60156.1 TonB-dependent siderophore receptor [Pseudothauera rhizosphaerae]
MNQSDRKGVSHVFRHPEPQAAHGSQAPRLALRPAAVAIHLLLAGVAAGGWAGAAQAQTPAAASARSYDIPAGPLSSVLTRFLGESGVLLTGSTDLAQGKHSPGVQGELTPDAALAALLAGTGLRAVADAQGRYVLQPAPVLDPSGEVRLPTITVQHKREFRVSKGATNLPMEIKDTPQSISTIDQETLRDFGVSNSNDALRLGTGVNVEEWETNRTGYNARGFDVMLTQIDGLGMTNDWGLVEGQLDTFLFDKIELIRGANGLLTGVGNASGTINFVRKRPTNKDGGEIQLTGGSHDLKRLALDYNKVLSQDGQWAGRLVVTHEDKDSHLRALHDERTAFYGVVEGQIGLDGVLTLGLTYQDSKQRSPMWGSLTLPYADGTLANFDVSASTSQDWTRWNNRSYNAFVEYSHMLSPDWEAKATYSHTKGNGATKLFYAYSLTGYLNDDNTGLVGWPYRSKSESQSDILDLSLTGRFDAFGRQHEAVFGLSHSKQTSLTYSYAGATFPVMPAFPYAGDVYAEPDWGAKSVASDGDQDITRLYAATRLALTDKLKGIIGINAIRLKRDGTAIYGGGTNLDNETTEKASPYVGVTYDITPDLLAYASYSDIFQAQDQRDVNGAYLAPMKGVNAEAGIKAEWLNRTLLTTFAVFSAKQKGLATIAGFDTVAQQNYYEPKDVKSRGFEIEATGRISADTQLTAGFTLLRLTGDDGKDIYEWVPRRTLKLRADTRVPMLPKLRVGSGVRWQSDVSKTGGAWQDAYVLADAFAAYELNDKATLRLNINNLFDKKYLRTVQYGAIYGASRTMSISLDYKL